MDKEAREQYDKLDKLSDLTINNGLIASLDGKLKTNKDNAQLLKFKAELLRKSGQLEAVNDVYKQLGITNNPIKLNSHSDQLINPDLRVLNFKSIQVDMEYSTVPLVVIDDFLTSESINLILEHVLAHKNDFRKANIDSNNPYYAPNKRATMVLDELAQYKNLFADFWANNFDSICEMLGISSFKMKTGEMKITNHINGGFFQTHADNTTLFGDSKRVISWLYYFCRQPKQFSGGDLFAFDTDVENQFYKEGKFTKIEAKHNRFIAMPSCYYHAVSPVIMPSGDFEDGRMAVAGHIRFMEKTH
ncbi:2OG-Fe(II) oxygenase [Aliikangiella sp. IMCC44359]|uniref:2OG-Fe(II) oxygenase n=1 Tax=Aliikangiella sp. IMCC44359 TaxID=3459125 RepID=UPI00403B22EF